MEKEKVVMADVEELPKAIVRRVVKDTLSQFSDDSDITIHKEALRAFCESARIFIHYISATANDLCKESKRQTINADDVLRALEEIEFPEFVQPLRACLDEFRQKNAGKKAEAAKSKEAKKRKEDSSLDNRGSNGKKDDGNEVINEAEDDIPEPKQKNAGKKGAAAKSKKVNRKRKVEEEKQDGEVNEDED